MPISADDMCKAIAVPILPAMSEAGLTAKALIKSLKSELKAKTVKHFTHNGLVVSKRSYVDWGTRQRARIDAHKLRGDYPAERQEIDYKQPLVVEIVKFGDKNGEGETPK